MAWPTMTTTTAVMDEDGPEDLNGDGYITVMRVADPSGDYHDRPGTTTGS